MNVRELMEELTSHNPETMVYLASDEEGNSFHHIGSFGKEGYGLYIYPTHEVIDPLDDVDDGDAK